MNTTAFLGNVMVDYILSNRYRRDAFNLTNIIDNISFMNKFTCYFTVIINLTIYIMTFLLSETVGSLVQNRHDHDLAVDDRQQKLTSHQKHSPHYYWTK